MAAYLEGRTRSIAAAAPWPRIALATERTDLARDLVRAAVALDLSGSMQAEDFELEGRRVNRVVIAKDVLKCLKSAIDNAENNHGLDVDGLVVTQAHVGKNITMKRMHARARGRANDHAADRRGPRRAR